SRRRHTRSYGDWSSDVCSSDLRHSPFAPVAPHNRQSFAVILNMHVPAFFDFHGIPAEVEWLNTGHALEALSMQLHGFNPSEKMRSEERRVGKVCISRCLRGGDE